MFLFKRHAAGRNACNFFKFVFAFAVAAPHGFDEAVAAVCNFDEFIKVAGSKGAVFSVFKSALIKTVANKSENFGDLGFKFVKRYEIFFAVVAANKNALVACNIAGSDFKTNRNTFHFIFSKFPAGGLFAVVKFYAAEFGKTFFNCVSCFKNTFFVLLCGNDYNLDRCNIGRRTSPLLSPWVMMIAPIRRVETPQEVSKGV